MFYIIGGALVVGFAGALTSSVNSLDLSALGLGSTSGIGGAVSLVGGFGIASGILITLGGFLMKSEIPARRKTGGILAVVMLFLGALPTLGGLLIGFILTAIGGYMGLTYKATRSNIVVPLGPVGSVTLGPQSAPISSADAPSGAGHGPLNYCIKCGSRLREGAIFCGACGARVPE